MITSTYFILAIAITACAGNGFYSNHIGGGTDQDALLESIVNLIQQNGGKMTEPHEVPHVLQRRQVATSVTVWVEGDVNSCVKPTSTIQSFCRIDYTVPAVILRRITKTLHFIINNFAVLQAQLSTSCQNSLKEILCKGTLPKCSDDRKSAIYSNYGSACMSLNGCGSKLINFNGLNTQSLCRSSGQQYTLSGCVKSSLTSLNSGYCGPLPKDITFPAYVEASLYQRSAIIVSLKASFNSQSISTACTNEWIKMACTSTPFCSSDRTKIVSAVTRQKCEKAISCLPEASRAILAMAWDCYAFPEENSQKMVMPSNQAYSNRAVGITFSPLLLVVAYLLSVMLF